MAPALTLLYIVCGLLTTLVGSTALKAAPQSAIHRSFFAVSIGTIIWMACLYGGFFFTAQGSIDLANTFFRIAFGIGALFVVALTRFFLVFPEQNRSFSKTSVTTYSLIAGFLTLSSLFTPWIYESVIITENGLGDQLGFLYGPYLLFLLFNYGLQIWLAQEKIRQSSGIQRRKISLTFVGFLAFFLATISTNAILPIFDIIIFQAEAPLFTLFFLIPAFYAIQRYRFFDLTSFSLNILRLSVLLGAFIGVTFMSSTLMPPTLAAMLGLGTFLSLHHLLPPLIGPHLRSFKNTLHELNANLMHASSFGELMRELEQTFIIDLKCQQLRLFFIHDTGLEQNIPTMSRNTCTNRIEEQQLSLLVSDEIRLQGLNPNCLELLQSQQASLALPLYLNTSLIGLLFIGHRPNQQSWSYEELNELHRSKEFITISFLNVLLESGLKEENDLIRQLIAEKTDDLRRHNEAIQSTINQQSELIATASHEFRTPLTIAMMKLEDALFAHDHDQQTLEDMKAMEVSLMKLKTLSEQLFDLERYQQTHVNLESTDLDSYLQGIVDQHQSLMKQRSLHLNYSCEGQPSTPLDRQQMEQVLNNLLHNAMKFSEYDSEIKLLCEQTSQGIQIRIQDQGSGIDDEIKPFIFDKYFSSGSPEKSLGMGLYLCKSIVEQHGGSLTVQDSPQGGTTMVISLDGNRDVSTPSH